MTIMIKLYIINAAFYKNIDLRNKKYCMIKLSFTVSFLLCAAFSISVFAQTPKTASTPTNDEKDVVKISTNLIQIDATVLDKKGSIVTGLTAEDFEIYENGKKQQITNFSFIELQPDKSAETIAVKPTKNSVPIPPVPTNLRPGQVRRTMALVVDDLGLSFVSIDAVKTSLRKFVDEQMQPNDLAAIVRTSAGAGVLQQFTSDKRILYSAINRIRWFPLGRGDVGAFTAVDQSDPPESPAYKETKDAALTTGTLGAVRYVINGMRELPGRKAVLLFSDGFKLSESVKFSENEKMNTGINNRIVNIFNSLTELANRSSVIIYGIDARGLVVPMPGADDGVRPSGGGDKFSSGAGEDTEKVTAARTELLYETQQGLKYLSEQTGGFAIVNNNNLSKGIERVLNDQKGYYLIGYQPDEETFDPRKIQFNKLTIKLKRPDLQVRYRNGFLGVKDEEVKPQSKTPRQQILAALTSPLSFGDIDLQLTSLFANDTKTGDFMRSLIYVNGKDLTFTEDANGWEKATFDVVAMIFGDNGNVIDEVSRTETVKARAETLQEIREKGFVSTITFPIKKPGAYQMRVVLRDAATSRIGSASQFIEVPNLKKDRLTLSGILLERVKPQINKNISAQNQFQSDEDRDAATRSFRAGTDVRFGFAIYNAKLNKAAKSPDLTMQFKVFRDGKEFFASREKKINYTGQADMQHLTSEGVFNLGTAIQPGDYVLQIIVKDLAEQGKNQIAAQWIDFEVTQ